MPQTPDDDLTGLLERWPYDPDDYIREVAGADGRRKLQVRFPMGIEQYELDGRPDGLRPLGHESYLHYFLHLRRQAAESDDPDSFRLTTADCDLLRDEAMIFSYRYDLLYQRKDHELVVRDTSRNLAAFDLLSRYAESAEDAESLELYRPFAVRLHYAARAMLCVKRRRFNEAVRMAQAGIQKLDQLDEIDDHKWRRERKTASAKLRRLARQIRRARPLSPRERLQKELKRALDREDYEVAAKLRDRIAAMNEADEATES